MFPVRPEELTLRHRNRPGRRQLGYAESGLDFASWRSVAADKLRELLAVEALAPGPVNELRRTVIEGVEIVALVMRVSDELSIPAYLLGPSDGSPVIAVHGHGEVEPCIGVGAEDYHHRFALRLAQAGHRVLCPELRGFGALRDLAAHLDGETLSYWRWGEHMTYPLVTDGLLRGRTMMGDTIGDLLRWEAWLGADAVDVVGISWGGDLACAYPVFSERVRRIFASGTLGSLAAVFAVAANAPAHCVPGLLDWFDRADIAGLNAPRPIAIHYGELDTPGPDNGSASYNSSVPDSIAELREIYAAVGADGAVELIVSPGLHHELDIDAVLEFLSRPDF